MKRTKKQQKASRQTRLVLSVFELIGSPRCFASEDGQKVYEQIETALMQGLSVSLSFRNVSALTPSFLSAAIGQLHGTFDEERLQSKLAMKDLAPDDAALVERVVEGAKEYFSRPSRSQEASKKG